ncbi:hypothetical protein GGF32_006997 [Allomyces javanicus]|nr:hypothetical protein GGF32_006997 [Allomyces javanicus]
MFQSISSSAAALRAACPRRPASLSLAASRWLPVLVYALFTLVLSVLAAPMPASNDAPPVSLPTTKDIEDQANKLVADTIALGVILIVTGLLFTFAGMKMMRICLFLAGAYLFAGFAFGILQTVEPAGGFGNRKAVYWGVGIAAALVGGALMVFFYKVGMFAIGAFGGYSLALWILALSSGGLIASKTGQIILIVVLALVGGIAMLYIEKHAVRICTAIGGAYFTMVGIDVFARTGFYNSTVAFLGGQSSTYTTSAKVYGMIAGYVVLAVLGIVVQYRTTRNSK